MSDLKKSILIQRITKPAPFKIAGKVITDNPFSFGGGFKNGGLSEEAMSVLRPILSWDYMGASEFEHGAVPKALHTMAKADLITSKIKIMTSADGHAWKDQKRGVCEAIVYLICPSKFREEIVARVRSFGCEDKLRTHEQVMLERSIRTIAAGTEPEVVGWLELDNGYFFTVDKEMFEKMCQLFEVKL